MKGILLGAAISCFASGIADTFSLKWWFLVIGCFLALIAVNLK